MNEGKRTFSGSSLKFIAMFTMTIDHIAVVILERVMISMGGFGLTGDAQVAFWKAHAGIYVTYFFMRLVGRVAFPIFCFLLIEGLKYTKSVKKYAFRLLLFAGLSEIPFNLATRGKLFDFSYQNVFFTLFFGLVAILCIQKMEQSVHLGKMLKNGLCIGIATLFGILAELLHTDYGFVGVLVIICMYLLRSSYLREILSGCGILTLFMGIEVTSFFAIPLVLRYNGQRGWKGKYVFYAFYPIHLLVLYGIACGMGLSV